MGPSCSKRVSTSELDTALHSTRVGHQWLNTSSRSYVMTPFRATNLSNVDIVLDGNLHLPQDIPTVQAIGEFSPGFRHLMRDSILT